MRLKSRRNFLPTFLSAIFFWVTFVFFLFKFPPENKLLIAVFYFLLFLSSFLTFSLALEHSRRGFLLSFGIISGLLLKQINQAHVLNFILLSGLILSIELYFRKQHGMFT
ncbi:MAG: hypothetical protein Q7S03_02290 [bacterium]|nr:hypothetical protein [bacterium]